MNKLYYPFFGLLLLCCGPAAIAQTTTIAAQDFEGAATDNLPFTTTPATYVNGEDVFDVVTTVGTGSNAIGPSSGSNFFGFRDLRNPTTGQVPLGIVTFDAVNVANATGVTVEFDYNVFAFDSPDDFEYRLILDNTAQPVITLVEGMPSSGGNSNGYQTATVPVPAGTSSVQLEVRVTQDGGGDWAGLDNVRVRGNVAPTTCNAAVGTLGTNPTSTPLLVCAGSNVAPDGTSLPDITLTYMAGADPGTDFSNTFIIADANGTIQLLPTTTTLDLSPLPAGSFELFQFNFDDTQGSTSAQFLNSIQLDGDTDDITQISAAIDAGTVCAALTGSMNNESPLAITVQAGPALVLNSLIPPTDCDGTVTPGSVSFTGATAGLTYSLTANVGGSAVGPFTAMADANGVITFDNLPAGTFNDVSVAAPGDCPSMQGTLNLNTVVDPMSCCPADAGTVDPAGPLTVCEGDEVPPFMATYDGTTTMDPNPMTVNMLAINEVRIDQPGGDDDEYFELVGMPGMSLDDITLLVIGSTGSDNGGVVEDVIDLTGQVIPADGVFLAAMASFSLPGSVDFETPLDFQNGNNVTFLLVQGNTASDNDDLDADNDGTLDMLPYTTLLDEVALLESVGSGALIYSTTTVGPDGNFVPAQVFRDMTGTFQIGQFNPADGTDTPGEANFMAGMFAYLYVITDSPGGLGNILQVVNGGPTAPYMATIGTLTPGTYCVGGLSFEGTPAEFAALGFSTGQEIQDAIAAGTICADYEAAGCTEVTVVPTLEVSNIVISDCTNPDASGTFTVSFEISGGQAPITLNGTDIMATTEGQVTGTGMAGDPFVFISNIINSDMPFSFQVSDAAATCDDPATVAGQISCDPCAGFEAPMPIMPIVVCANDTAVIAPMGGGTPNPLAPTELFFSEYVEASFGNNKAVEIFNGTALPVDLSTYMVEIYRNGDMTPNSMIQLVGTILPGDVFVLANSGAIFADEADQTTGAVNFNGDDDVVLTNGGVAIDIIGQIGVDPGTAFTGGGVSTRDQTIVRNSDVRMGDTDGTDPFDPSAEFTSLGENVFTNLGSYTNDNFGPAFPIVFNLFDNDPTTTGTLIASSDTSFSILPANLPAAGTTTTFFITAESTTPACESAAIAVDVTVNAAPVVNPTSISTGLCSDGTLVINANAGGGSGTFTDFSFEVTGGTATGVQVASITGMNGTISVDETMFTAGTAEISVTATDDNGCTSDPVVVTLNVADCEIEISDPCGCLNNATTLDNGQFSEEIKVSGPAGQTFSVVAVEGLFETTSPSPPAAPTPIVIGTQLTEEMPGMYFLRGIHVDAIGYSLTVGNTNGDVLMISSTCFYPEPSTDLFDGDICLFTPVIDLTGGNTTMDANGAAGTGTFLIDGVPATQFDPMALGIGTFTVTYTFDAGTATPNDPTDPGCVQSITQEVNIVESSSQLICNGTVNVSLDQNCEARILPDDVLEGSYACFDDYQVVLEDAIGQPLGDVATGAMIGMVVRYRVIHLPTGNSCWGNVNIEDKTGPVLSCGDVSIECFEDPAEVAFPTAIDNCDPNPEVTLVDLVTVSDNTCTGVVFERTFVAYDNNGMASAPCTQLVTVNLPAGPDVPEDIIFSCDQFTAFPNITDVAPLSPAITDTDLTTPEVIDASATLNNFILQTTGSGQVEVGTGTYCPFGVTNSDDTISTCGNTFKILRTFTIFDWCTNTLVTTDINGDDALQIIKILDREAPTISAAPAIVSANVSGMHPQACMSTGLIPAPVVSDNCGTVSLQIFTPAGEAIYANNVDGSAGGTIPAPGLALGTYTITYQATDACGNVTSVTGPLTVVDDIAPIAICDQITSVTLTNNDNGTTIVQASVFDDGSTDNCGVDRFEVARMAPNPIFGPTVAFDCGDAGTTVMVIFRVFDFFGNFNDCMVEAIIEDKSNVSLDCEDGGIIDCNDLFAIADDVDALNALFPVPVFSGGLCGTTEPVIGDPVISLGNCSDGTVTRTITFLGEECEQTVTVIPVSNFVVTFPDDLTIDCDMDDDGQTDPTPLPDGGAGVPEIFFDDCELVGVSHADQTFDVVEDACYKIIRQWTVINWCVVGEAVDQEGLEEDSELAIFGQFGPGFGVGSTLDERARTYRDSWTVSDRPTDPTQQFSASDTDEDNNPWDGYITYQQTIKVNDIIAPMVEVEDLEVCITGTECSAAVSLDLPVMDDCSGVLDVIISGAFQTEDGPVILNNVTEDIDQDDAVGVTAVTIPGVLPGVYDVTYSVTDNCGNVTPAAITVTVRDCKLPTPYCQDGIVIVTMPSTGMIEIFAEDFDLGSFDNCPGDLTASFGADQGSGLNFQGDYDPDQTSIIIDCDDVNGAQATVLVDVYFTDAAGNFDFCSTIIRVQANDNCGNGTGDPLVVVGGAIQTETLEGVADVEVNLSGTTTPTFMTNASGEYTFSDLIEGGDYSVVPAKDTDPRNGVSTYDVYLIGRHVLGIETLDSPYKIIAADINRSGSVTALDMAELRKLILYINLDFPANTSWRFVDRSYTFNNPTDPFAEPFPELVNINNIDSDMLNVNFVGVKIGDVNNSVEADNLHGSTSEARNNGTAYLQISDRTFRAGETVEVPLSLAKAVDLFGYQATLQFDAAALNLSDVHYTGSLAADHVNTELAAEGQLLISWTAATAPADDAQVQLTFVARNDGLLSDYLTLSDRYLHSEAYHQQRGLVDLALRFDAQTVRPETALFQNQPNPFAGATTIRYYLADAAQATLRIYDAAGRELYRDTAQRAAGTHEVRIERSELAGGGVLYYRLDTDTFTATRKMIVE